MTLTQEEKNALKELKNSYWWTILQKVVDEHIKDFVKKEMSSPTFNLENEDTKRKINDINLYTRAIKAVLKIAEVNTLEIIAPLSWKWE